MDESVTYDGLDRARVWMLEGMRAYLVVEGHEDEVLLFRVVADPRPSTYTADEYAAVGFAIADAMLEHMNWID